MPPRAGWSRVADGALVVHGFTGSPHSVGGLADAFRRAGFDVAAPLLPGHGTTVDDLSTHRWDDWAAAVESAYQELAGRCDRVVAAGLSMGGTLVADLAARRPGVAALVVVNPYIEPPADSFLELLRNVLAEGIRCIPAIGGDLADPSATEASYPETPIEPLLSLCEELARLAAGLEAITCPTLIFTSRVDHVVPPESSDVLASRVSGPVERVFLERSHHVATLDFDKGLIEERAVAFARQALAAPAYHGHRG